MTDHTEPVNLPPFLQSYRASGVLLHITSLPSPFGIGDMGPGAFAWVDRLHEAGQSWWQALPFGPTGYGNSPYQSLSSFAANGLLVSPELLSRDGLLLENACEGHSFSSSVVDFGAVIPFKQRLLDQIWGNFSAGLQKDLGPAYQKFCHLQAHWLEDYALFRALKQRYQGVSYLDWPTELVRRTPAAITRARKELSKLSDKVRFAQFLTFRQAEQLKQYAHSRGIGLIGDLPFFDRGRNSSSSMNSSGCAHTSLESGQPCLRLGGPPPYRIPILY
jgi:4-alpha-glucanotransferase